MRFADKLKSIREMQRLSQADLAKKTGLQTSAISHFETGGREPSLSNFTALVRALKVPADMLLSDPEAT